MTIIDFIDVNDDTIDLSSDEETVEQDHNATQQAVFVLGGEEKQDEQAVFVLAGQERQDEQAAFVSAGKGSQEATESGKSLVPTASPSVMEKVSLDTAEPNNCPNSATSAPLPTTKLQVVSAGEESQEATESGNSLVATASPSVMEKVSLDTAEPKNCPNSPTSAPLPSPTSTTPKALTSEVADTQLVATQSPSVMENVPFDTAESKNCTISPTTAPLPSPASTTPKTVTSEVGDTKLVRLKNPKKYYTSASRRSRSFEQKRECCDSPVEEPAADHKRSRMVDAAEESAYSADHAESAETLSTDSTN